jgi:ABC-type sugar transport system ATPase subunit
MSVMVAHKEWNTQSLRDLFKILYRPCRQGDTIPDPFIVHAVLEFAWNENFRKTLSQRQALNASDDGMLAPIEFYRKPQNRYVAQFLGKANIFPVTVTTSEKTEEIWAANGEYCIAVRKSPPHNEPGEYLCLVRPECWSINDPGADALPGKLKSLMFLGDRTEIVVTTPIRDQLLLVPGHRSVVVGDSFQLTADPAQIHLFSDTQQ